MSDSPTKTPEERTQERKEWGQKKYRKTVIRESIKVGNEALAVSNHYRVACILRDKLLPAVGVTPSDLDHYHMQLRKSQLQWEWESLTRFIENPDKFVLTLASETAADRMERLNQRASGFDPLSTAAVTVGEAFRSVESIAKHEKIIKSELSNQSQVHGHSLQTGVLFSPWEYESPDIVNLVAPDEHPPVTCIQGLAGFGKSTNVETIVEDRIATRFDPERVTHKVIEFDIDELEGGLYDTRSARDDLAEIREENEAPVWWNEVDMEQLLRERGEHITKSVREQLDAHPVEEPEVEILAPLTRDLEGAEIPFNTEEDEFDIRPFTIPASDLNRRALNTLLSHTTNVQANFLERAYQQVSADKDDWTLSDLSNQIWATDATEGVKERLENALKSLQHVGFIRDKESRFCLEWEEIFESTDKVTVFTTSNRVVGDTSQKMMVLSYLLNAIYSERKDLGSLPRLTLAMRELHFYAPTDQAAREDETERDLQDAMSAELQEVAARHRHEDIEILTDTQQFVGQVKKRIRNHVERVISFRSQWNTADALFRELIGGDNDKYVGKIARDFDKGECAALGFTGSSRPFEMPIQAFPPMSHHYDAKREDSGWTVRVDNNEELVWREAPWSASVPERLEFSRGEKKPSHPVGKFVFEFISKEPMSEWEPLDHVYGAYTEFAREEGLTVLSKLQFGKKYSNFHADGDKGRKMIDGVNFSKYECTRLNKSAMEWVKAHYERHWPDNCAECESNSIERAEGRVPGWECEECDAHIRFTDVRE